MYRALLSRTRLALRPLFPLSSQLVPCALPFGLARPSARLEDSLFCVWLSFFHSKWIFILLLSVHAFHSAFTRGWLAPGTLCAALWRNAEPLPRSSAEAWASRSGRWSPTCSAHGGAGGGNLVPPPASTLMSLLYGSHMRRRLGSWREGRGGAQAAHRAVRRRL